ncbi:leucyl aminopeptidase, partial [bacterium]|nr:leucyl aminopeptidase [bacterium]
MKFSIVKESLDKVKADAVVITCFGSNNAKKPKTPIKLRDEDGGKILDKKLSGIISKEIRLSDFKGKKGSTLLILTHGKVAARYVIVLGLGSEKDFHSESLRQAAGKLCEDLESINAKSIAFILENKSLLNIKESDRVSAFVEGLILGGYKFEDHKSKEKKEPFPLQNCKIIYKGSSQKTSKAVKEAQIKAKSTCYARDLTNTSSNFIIPDSLVKEARKLARSPRISIKALSLKEIKKQKMGAFLAIAAGSNKTPAFVHLKYKPAKKSKKRIAIVGKGITFDTGGYSIKTREMQDMFHDMAGAAVVLAVFKAIAELKPNIEVDGIFAACENMIDANATKPGDIVTSRKGTTIEIQNMDAEGRMILADALDYISDQKPDIIIDIATLTGHVPYGLGELYTALLGNDQKLVDELLAVAKDSGEKMWQYPLEKEY